MVLKLLKEVLRVGEATVPYPFVAVELAPGFRGKPEHNSELCITCAACAIACPSNALSVTTDLDQGTRTWSIFVGRCIYCGRCEEVCPTRAITLSHDFELAVMNKQDLYQQAEYTLAACHQCGTLFAPLKEIEYVIALLQHSELPEERLAHIRALVEMCPECKRKNDLPKLASAYQEAD